MDTTSKLSDQHSQRKFPFFFWFVSQQIPISPKVSPQKNANLGKKRHRTKSSSGATLWRLEYSTFR